MTPEIRYTRTADGVTIAYYAIGAGPAIFNMPAPPFGNTEVMWHVDEFSDQLSAAAERAKMVQYDLRGFGLSDREVTDFSLEAMVRDLEAVADTLNLQRFCMTTWNELAIVALTYAARHPERVIALHLREGIAQGICFPSLDSQLKQASRDWPLYTRTVADSTANIRTVKGLAQVLELIDKTATPDTYLRYLEQVRSWDARDVLASVSMPVLVTNDGYARKEDGRWLAASLPQGSFVSSKPARGEPSPSEAAMQAFFLRAFTVEFGTRVGSSNAEPAGSPRRANDTPLTTRETEILRLVVAGKSGREIAEELVLSPRTVERHIANIYRKTDTHGRAQLAAFAVRRNVG